MRGFERVSSIAAVTAAAVVAAAVGLTAVGAGVASAASGHGYDVSWPQCGASLPGDGDFGIVGVADGKPYTDNPCLAAQYQWAAASNAVGFYMNTSNPGAASSTVNWYGQTSPNAACSRSDEAACAYDYGFNAAEKAFLYAQAQTGQAAHWSWWLDVETANSWSSNTSLNVADVLGSVAYLRSQGVPVGAYSTGYQWGVITGGAQIPDILNWVAGATNESQATSWCASGRSFSAGPVVLVQWVQGDIDVDHACSPLPIATAPTPTPPTKAGLNDILGDVLSLNLPKLLQDLSNT